MLKGYSAYLKRWTYVRIVGHIQEPYTEKTEINGARVLKTGAVEDVKSGTKNQFFHRYSARTWHVTAEATPTERKVREPMTIYGIPRGMPRWDIILPPNLHFSVCMH